MENEFSQIGFLAVGSNFTGCIRCYVFGWGLRSLSYRGGDGKDWTSPPLSKAQRVVIRVLLQAKLPWCFVISEGQFWLALHYVNGVMMQGFLETPSPNGPTTYFRFGKNGEVLPTHRSEKRVLKSKMAVDTFEVNLDSFPANAAMVEAVSKMADLL